MNKKANVTDDMKVYRRAYYWANHEKILSKNRDDYYKKYYAEHKEHIKATVSRNKHDNPEYLKEERQRRWSRRRQEFRISLQKLRIEVFTHYGNGRCACVKCGFDDTRALTLDHINDDGAEQRRNKKWPERGGVHFYRLLRQQDYPEGLQTLCYNCNLIKYREHRESLWVTEPPRQRGKARKYKEGDYIYTPKPRTEPISLDEWFLNIEKEYK